MADQRETFSSGTISIEGKSVTLRWGPNLAIIGCLKGDKIKGEYQLKTFKGLFKAPIALRRTDDSTNTLIGE
eukprot:CAMPEP_0119129926 /NCGR_PEP_ID=MMETSP1310-20130426/7473_1 /TAXON_ID=464262 /ORGANISM="Genus nov. species nov., Strain RCC2339" /LENGTH=71 /DNA_ID=CAMNT_0007120387 /DNA_START=39 /DNA_END=254 /DNA_ORIENTATION=-